MQADANKTRKRALWRLVRALGWMTAIGLLLVGGAALGGYLWLKWTILDTLPQDLSEYRTWRPQASVEVRDRNDAVIDEFYLDRRVWVDLEELPEHVPEAFVAAEDRRFWTHKGVDLQGLARAAWVNLVEGGVSQGGSTLTQQLVKNLIVGNERSYERKLREAVLAYRLDQELGKERVLELYLNHAALGSGNYGVEAAARDYFGVSARDLDPGQAAMIAGLLPAPSRYSPRKDPELAAERRRIVLGGMVAEGYLAAEDAETYLDDPVRVPRVAAPVDDDLAAYRTEVRRELRRILGERAAFEDAGLVVHTAVDPEVQRVAVGAVRSAIEAHFERQGPRIPVRQLGPEAAERFLVQGAGLRRADDGTLEAPAVGDCLEVLVGPKGLDTLLAGPHAYALSRAERQRLVPPLDPEGHPEPVARRVRPGDVLDVCVEGDGVVRLGGRPWAEGAAVVLDHRTGEVLAVVGGYESELEGFVRATQARRQPGSSFKPYVYATALAEGRTQLDIVVDAPISLPAGNGKLWTPKNYGGGYAGSITLRGALARSLNTVAVRLALASGPHRIATLARDAGVRTPLRADLTMALGASEVTPMDQAVGYATLARGGRAGEAVYLTRLEDVAGEVIAEAGDRFDRGGTARRLPGGLGEVVVEPGVAYEISDMLREVVRAGTARRVYDPAKDRAGKTGTTNGFMDAWFVGFTPRYVVAVWIGTDGTGSLGASETGGRTALPAWKTIVEALPEPDGERRLAPPETVLVQHQGLWVGVGRGRAGKVLPRVQGGFPEVSRIAGEGQTGAGGASSGATER